MFLNPFFERQFKDGSVCGRSKTNHTAEIEEDRSFHSLVAISGKDLVYIFGSIRIDFERETIELNPFGTKKTVQTRPSPSLFFENSFQCTISRLDPVAVPVLVRSNNEAADILCSHS